MSLSIPGQCHSLYTTTLFGVSGSTLYQHLGRCLQFSRGLLMKKKTSLNDIELMTCVIPYKIFGSNSFYDLDNLCYSMLPLFVKDDLVMAAVATTVLHALICKTCLNISSTKDDQLLDRAKTTLVCFTTSENYR